MGIQGSALSLLSDALSFFFLLKALRVDISHSRHSDTADSLFTHVPGATSKRNHYSITCETQTILTQGVFFFFFTFSQLHLYIDTYI